MIYSLTQFTLQSLNICDKYMQFLRMTHFLRKKNRLLRYQTYWIGRLFISFVYPIVYP